jgi:hypothetical protein
VADFCKQCSETDYKDLAGLSTEEDTKAGLYPVVLCEGCGPTQVNHLGECVSVDCIKKHGVQK